MSNPTEGYDPHELHHGDDGFLEAAQADARALDELNLLLSAPEWPGASGMEDVCEIVRATGRREIPGAPEWRSH